MFVHFAAISRRRCRMWTRGMGADGAGSEESEAKGSQVMAVQRTKGCAGCPCSVPIPDSLQQRCWRR